LNRKDRRQNDERANGLTLLQRSGIGSISGSGRLQVNPGLLPEKFDDAVAAKASETTEK
jgi:hypothetical protein